MKETTTTNQTSQFQIYFGSDRILDNVCLKNLSQVMNAISDNLFMFNSNNFQFSEKSITVEIQTIDENYNYSYEKIFKITVSKFNLIKKMNLDI